uniref:Putative secreted peptide n=1 Tax=Anopheles braziliensis TaxID=58242 RepID=A0A2M3ZNK2_9DIPT
MLLALLLLLLLLELLLLPLLFELVVLELSASLSSLVLSSIRCASPPPVTSIRSRTGAPYRGEDLADSTSRFVCSS